MSRNLLFVSLTLMSIAIHFCVSFTIKESNDIKLKIISINDNCFENKDCVMGSDDNRLCVDHKCQCKPNYQFDYINNLCRYFTCRLDKDCQSHDSNRRCDAYDGCKCKDEYVEDRKSRKCMLRRTIGSPCDQDFECWTDTDNHRVCQENTCACKLFYELNNHSKKCIAKNSCDDDKDCHRFDQNRVCDEYGLCICDYGYEADSIGEKFHKILKPLSLSLYSSKGQIWSSKPVIN